MSSVTRFLRQIPTGASYVNPAALATNAAVCDFVPTSGNYVGNYPPGVMVPATTTGLSAVLGAAGAQALIRDMGKTIFAAFADTATATPSAFSGFFREYQLIVPTAITAPQGFLGGAGGNTFGVIGPSVATAPGSSTYATFYLPVPVGGVGSALSAVAVLPAISTAAGGQM
jgi:hypothetical protein